MKYIKGETLANYLKRESPLTFVQGLSILKQICEGVAAAHLAEICHGDLKPLNIMIDHSGFIEVLDFGLAQWAK